MTDMVYGSVFRGGGEPILPRWWRTVDKWSIGCVLALFGIGLLLGLASSPPLAERHGLWAFHYFERQVAYGAVSLLIMFAVTLLAPRTVRRVAVLVFLASFGAMVLLPFLGTDFGKGAVRWFSFGFGSVQPSEFLKPGFIVLVGWLIAASDEVAGPPGKCLSFALALTVVALLALQPDYGQACLLFFAWGVMYFVGGAHFLLLLLVAGLIISCGALAYENSEHVARRIDGFLSTEVDPTTQLGYAANAIREGGLFGVGVGEGTVKWSLPDAHTDFIIAVAAEEYGLILVLVVILLYSIIAFRSLYRLTRERDPFIRLAGTGLACTFAMQALINLSVAVRLLPAKGMTLPFVSYGGSSLLAGAMLVGMLLAFTRTRPQGDINGGLAGIGR